uniref:Uncharacterized protein n=1 Tax=Utricularia reniformis TaxID=192314 RepID=A0A1Y0B363_9LAMI|nr:hypothetical protein AEK19_MT1643 [Utricularia reniformis]ART31827.1 hypothetical protein AEK19_MT1643 [Utricularia reniformis]
MLVTDPAFFHILSEPITPRDLSSYNCCLLGLFWTQSLTSLRGGLKLPNALVPGDQGRDLARAVYRGKVMLSFTVHCSRKESSLCL